MKPASQISLRNTIITDLDSFFQFQQDQEARYLAAFMPDNASDKNAFIAKHAKFLSDPDKTTKTILV